MATIKYAHVPNIVAGEKYLQKLGERIFKCEELRKYFYADYLLEDGQISVEIAEQVINMQEVVNMYPRSYYSAKEDKVKFFVLSQMFNRKKRHILRSAKFIDKERFEFEYVLNKTMKQEFEQLNNCFFIELEEDSQVEYALVLDGENKELLMLVCL